jgi:hypothetical protein
MTTDQRKRLVYFSMREAIEVDNRVAGPIEMALVGESGVNDLHEEKELEKSHGIYHTNIRNLFHERQP